MRWKRRSDTSKAGRVGAFIAYPGFFQEGLAGIAFWLRTAMLRFMASVTIKGTPYKLLGEIPETGQAAPDFTLVMSDMHAVSLKTYRGQTILLSIYPSLDTPVCAKTALLFNQRAASYRHSVVICASIDTPFAIKRFCMHEKIKNLVVASTVRDPGFGANYGVQFEEGPLQNFLARSLFVLDQEHTVRYVQVVSELTVMPDYEAALAALDKVAM